jgi:predicted Zn-dependent protease
MKFATICILVLSFALQACATNPVTGESDFALISESEEIERGKRYHQHIIARYGMYDDAALQAYVNRIGKELANKSHRAHLHFTFTVLDSPEINAFALPGGYIYITRGIMAYLDSEAELAGVLGHEIGHVTARHSVRQQAGEFTSNILSILITAATGDSSLGNLSQQLGTGLVRGYGREHELEADRLGAEYLHNSGYDPDAMLEVIGVLKDQEVYERALAQKENRQPSTYHGVFSTHPRNDDRLKTVVRAAKKLPSQSYRDANRRTYYDMIDGMVWGPSLKQGVVVRNRFMHPGLKFTLQKRTAGGIPGRLRGDRNFPYPAAKRRPATRSNQRHPAWRHRGPDPVRHIGGRPIR